MDLLYRRSCTYPFHRHRFQPLLSLFLAFSPLCHFSSLVLLISSDDRAIVTSFYSLSLVSPKRCKNGRLVFLNEPTPPPLTSEFSPTKDQQTEKSVVGGLGKWHWFRLDFVAVLMFLEAETCLWHPN